MFAISAGCAKRPIGELRRRSAFAAYLVELFIHDTSSQADRTKVRCGTPGMTHYGSALQNNALMRFLFRVVIPFFVLTVCLSGCGSQTPDVAREVTDQDF